jgi:hypothetical protein
MDDLDVKVTVMMATGVMESILSRTTYDFLCRLQTSNPFLYIRATYIHATIDFSYANGNNELLSNPLRLVITWRVI